MKFILLLAFIHYHVPMPKTCVPHKHHSCVRSGRHYKTAEALAWVDAVAIVARGQQVKGKAHEVTYVVYQGFKSKGDVDNYAKCILDSLVACGVLKSDASVVSMHAHKLRDRDNPRTEIHVRAL